MSWYWYVLIGYASLVLGVTIWGYWSCKDTRGYPGVIVAYIKLSLSLWISVPVIFGLYLWDCYWRSMRKKYLTNELCLF